MTDYWLARLLPKEGYKGHPLDAGPGRYIPGILRRVAESRRRRGTGGAGANPPPGRLAAPSGRLMRGSAAMILQGPSYRRAFPSPVTGTRRILLIWYTVRYEPTTRAFEWGVIQTGSREALR
jgi:hypothetical protein